MDLEKLRILIRTEVQNSKDLDNLKGKLQETKKETSYTSTAFKDLGGSLAASLGGAAIAMAAFSAASKFVGDSIKEASDAAEQASKFNVVFGDSAESANQQLAAFGDSVNRSKYDLTSMAATVQDTFVPLGFARDKAAELSVGLVKLATDVASFNNASDTEVMSNFQSALVGQGEAVRKYGIIINETTLNQELLNMGITGGAKAASEQEKVQARLNIIYKGTTDAQGDAARTSDSYANTQKGLAAATKSLEVAFGKELTPALAEATRGLIEYVKFAENMIEITSDMNKENSGLLEGLMLISKTFPNIFETGKNIGSLMAEFNKWKAAQDDAKKSTEGFTGVLPGFAAAMGTAAEKTLSAKEATDKLKQSVNDTKEAFSYLNDMVAGEVGKGFDDYKTKQDETKKSISELKKSLEDLNNTPWLDPSGSKRADISVKLGEEKKALSELSEEYKRNTQEMLLNMTQKYLLSQVEIGKISSEDAINAVNKIAEAQGLIDKATAAQNEMVAKLVSDFASGKLSSDQFAAAIQGIGNATVDAAGKSKNMDEFSANVKKNLDAIPAEKTIKINIEAPTNTMDAFRKMDESFGAKDAKITITADAAGAKTEIKSVQDILDGYPTTKSTDIATTGTSRVTTELGIVSQSLDNLPTSKTIQVSTSGAGEVQNDFWMIQQSIDALQDRDYWVTVHVKKVQDDSSDEAAADTINPGNGMARRGNSSGASQTVNYTYYAPVTYTSDTTMVTDLQARRF